MRHPSAKPQLRQEEGGEGCWLGGRACSPRASPGRQSQSSQVRVVGSAWQGWALTCCLSCGQACFAGAGRGREGPGSQQQRVRTSSCQLLAAIWAGAVPVFQICLPFGERKNSVLGRYLPLILRLLLKTQPNQPQKEGAEACQGPGSLRGDLLWAFPSEQNLYSYSTPFIL